MPDIPCKEPGCTEYISDPCVKMKGLFLLYNDLSERLKVTKIEDQFALLNSVNHLIEIELGLYLKDSNAFLEREKLKQENVPIRFTLKCIKNHVNQYFITCHS